MQGEEEDGHDDDGEVDPDVVGKDCVERDGLLRRRVIKDDRAPAGASETSVAELAWKVVEGDMVETWDNYDNPWCTVYMMYK